MGEVGDRFAMMVTVQPPARQVDSPVQAYPRRSGALAVAGVRQARSASEGHPAIARWPSLALRACIHHQTDAVPRTRGRSAQKNTSLANALASGSEKPSWLGVGNGMTVGV